MEIPCPNWVSFDAPSAFVEFVSKWPAYSDYNPFLFGHHQYCESSWSSWNQSLLFYFYFQLEPPTGMSPPMPPVTPTPQPVTDLQRSSLKLSQEELKVCEKWIIPYSSLETSEDRLKMLRGSILPRLAKVNVGMAEEVWKPRKSVSILHPRIE